MSTYYKILLGLIALAYFISPVDLIPDLFLPYIGWIDDTFIVGLILYYLKNGRLPDFFYGKTRGNSSGTKNASPNGSPFSGDAFARKDHTAPHGNSNHRSPRGSAGTSRSRQNRHYKNHSQHDGEPKGSKSQAANQGSPKGRPDARFRETFHSTGMPPKENRTPHEVLGIQSNAGKDEIVAAYRKAVKEYHPDRVAHLGKDLQELANKKFIEIREAYNQLMKRY